MYQWSVPLKAQNRYFSLSKCRRKSLFSYKNGLSFVFCIKVHRIIENKYFNAYHCISLSSLGIKNSDKLPHKELSILSVMRCTNFDIKTTKEKNIEGCFLSVATGYLVDKFWWLICHCFSFLFNLLKIFFFKR